MNGWGYQGHQGFQGHQYGAWYNPTTWFAEESEGLRMPDVGLASTLEQVTAEAERRKAAEAVNQARLQDAIAKGLAVAPEVQHKPPAGITPQQMQQYAQPQADKSISWAWVILGAVALGGGIYWYTQSYAPSRGRR